MWLQSKLTAMKSGSWKWLMVLGVLALCAVVRAQTPSVRFARIDEMKDVLDELGDALPTELKVLPTVSADVPWGAWLAARDGQIRGRLAQGDQDTIVNWLLSGNSFTAQPRTVLDLNATDAQAVKRLADLIGARVDDLLRALASPGTDERRVFARRFFEGNGFTFTTVAGIDELRYHLLVAIQRMAAEEADRDQELDAARQAANSEVQFALRSHLFADRGLSIDTSLSSNYALERSFETLKMRGMLKPGAVRRVAIIGAGLDVADKEDGFDFFPQQTVQPFAVIDALRRLQLAPAAGTPDVVVFDISPRVLEHVTRAHNRAAMGTGYTLTLALAKGREWLPEYQAYWKALGDRIGTAAVATVDQSLAARADVRTVRIPASVVQHVSALDLNIITQRVDDGNFDLIIATDVFIYYNVLDQSLAVANIEHMLRNGGFLLSNSILPESQVLPIELIDSAITTAAYARTGTERILPYRRMDGSVR